VLASLWAFAASGRPNVRDQRSIGGQKDARIVVKERRTMPEIGDKRQCSHPGCTANQVLRERHSPEVPMPGRIDAGSPYPPTTQKLHVWMCEMNPLHVEVWTWGMRPTKKCPTCGGTMVHSDKWKMHAPDDIRKKLGQPYARITEIPGFVCLENHGHFEES
jgi:hypothetical protein